MVKFYPENHRYISIDPLDTKRWVSATGVLERFKEKFDTIGKSEDCANNPEYKLYGHSAEEIRNIWKMETTRATDLGSWYHAKQEEKMLRDGFIVHKGVKIPVFPTITDEFGVKTASKQQLINGCYPEHLVFDSEYYTCGQSDKPIIYNKKITVRDFKSNKEVTTGGYVGKSGIPKKLLYPLNHLEDCDVVKFGLQLSIYGYTIKKHNPGYEVEDLFIEHVKFETDGEDKYGYPITRRDKNGEPIIKEVIEIPVPYLESEVKMMLNRINYDRKKGLIV